MYISSFIWIIIYVENAIPINLYNGVSFFSNSLKTETFSTFDICLKSLATFPKLELYSSCSSFNFSAWASSIFLPNVRSYISSKESFFSNSVLGSSFAIISGSLSNFFIFSINFWFTSFVSIVFVSILSNSLILFTIVVFSLEAVLFSFCVFSSTFAICLFSILSKISSFSIFKSFLFSFTIFSLFFKFCLSAYIWAKKLLFNSTPLFVLLFNKVSSLNSSVLSGFPTKSPFNNASFIAWYIALNTLLSSSNLTSNLAGCTFTSTFSGFISKFNITNPYFPIVIIPLKACSAALVKVLSFTYLLLTKNIWLALLEREIIGFPTTPVTFISSYW